MSLVCDIFNVNLIDDDGTIFATKTLSTADVNIQCASNDVNAGRGDALIAVLHSGRTADISLAEVSFRWDWIAKQLGQTATTGATTAWALEEWYECEDLDGDSAGTAIGVILPNAPLASASGLKLFKEDGTELASPAGYTITDNKITIIGGVVGQKIRVAGYKYTTDATASTIIIDNTSFADGVTCVLETLEIDEDETVLARIQYIFDECLLDGNINIQTTKERQANATNVNLRAIKPRTSNRIGRMIRIPISSS